MINSVVVLNLFINGLDTHNIHPNELTSLAVACCNYCPGQEWKIIRDRLRNRSSPLTIIADFCMLLILIHFTRRFCIGPRDFPLKIIISFFLSLLFFCLKYFCHAFFAHLSSRRFTKKWVRMCAHTSQIEFLGLKRRRISRSASAIWHTWKFSFLRNCWMKLHDYDEVSKLCS